MSTPIEQPPTPRLLLSSLRNAGYTLESAIADIIDNSITAQASMISVQFRGHSDFLGRQWIAICDNGSGMNYDELLQGMKFGSRDLGTARQGVLDLGRFGLGLKTASISQCRKLTVVSWKDGKCNGMSWDLDKISTSWLVDVLSNEELEGDPVLKALRDDLSFDIQTHGTIVLWESLDRDYAQSDQALLSAMSNVRKHIGLVFHRFMVHEAGFSQTISFDMNNRTIEPEPPFGPANQNRFILMPESFKCKGYTVKYQPYILPRAIYYATNDEYEKHGGKEGYLQNQGFYVYRNRRLIEKATWFRKRKKEYKTQLLRIQLDIPAELDEEWGIDVRKSQITPPMDIQQRVDAIVESAMEQARSIWDAGARPVNVSRGFVTPMWRIERHKQNKQLFCYKINPEHELYKLIQKHVDPEIRPIFKSYLDSLASTFPYKRYKSDFRQNADLKYMEDDPDNNKLALIINTLYSAGYDEDQIRETLMKSETEFDQEIIASFISQKFSAQ